MDWSHYSERLFTEFIETDNNIIVQACPGAGKTTNIKHIWELDNKPTVYLVFNKHNQLEAEGKMVSKDKSAVLTLNSLGHRAIMQAYGKVVLETNKVYKIIRDEIFPSIPRGRRFNNHSEESSKEKQEKINALQKAIGLLKMQCDIPSGNELYSFLSHYDCDYYDGIQEHIEKVMNINDDMTNIIDFNDQIRFPVIHGLSMPQYHNVLVDEAQDLNVMQAMMIEGIGKRYVLVGDKRQAIYGFRGAMNDSMDILKDKFNCVELPLKLTYRCAKNIVEEARFVFPNDIEALDTAQDGVVSSCDRDKQVYSSQDALILCRNNKPLVEYAYKLLQRNIACFVRGRDIGLGLIRLIDRLEVSSVRHLIDRLEEWRCVEVAKASKRQNEQKIASVNDKADSLLIFINRCSLDEEVNKVKENIESLFQEGKGICLSTVHKAKGLEAESAYILEPSLMPASYAQQVWQQEQERNIKYVAVTRAKNALTYLI